MVLPRLRDEPSGGRLGIASPTQNRLLYHTPDYLRDIAVDLGVEWTDLLAQLEASSVSDWRRVERRHLEDACLELLDVVRPLPLPIREILVARAVGLSWRRILAARPDRVLFSMQDDHAAGLQRVWDRGAEAVRRVV